MQQPKPALSPAWQAILAGLIAERGELGPEWCRDFGVGARRSALMHRSAYNVIPLFPGLPRPRTHEEELALELFRSECHKCGRCELADE
jgi:hypothetical protein